LVIIESLAMETPVVATDCSAAVREFLKDGEYGDIVPVESVTALTDALADHLRDASRLRRKAAAAEGYVQHFSGERMCDEYLSYFSRLLAK